MKMRTVTTGSVLLLAVIAITITGFMWLSSRPSRGPLSDSDHRDDRRPERPVDEQSSSVEHTADPPAAESHQPQEAVTQLAREMPPLSGAPVALLLHLPPAERPEWAKKTLREITRDLGSVRLSEPPFIAEHMLCEGDQEWIQRMRVAFARSLGEGLRSEKARRQRALSSEEAAAVRSRVAEEYREVLAGLALRRLQEQDDLKAWFMDQRVAGELPAGSKQQEWLRRMIVSLVPGRFWHSRYGLVRGDEDLFASTDLREVVGITRAMKVSLGTSNPDSEEGRELIRPHAEQLWRIVAPRRR
jgi:hypothetical protein